MAVIGCVALLFLLCERRENARQAESERWRVVDEKYWPYRLPGFFKSLDQRKISRENFATLYQPYEDLLFWKSDASPKLLDAMTARWDLVAVSKTDKLMSRVLSEIPPDYAQLVPEGDEVDYYINKEWPIEWKGDQIGVLHNKTKNKFVVRHYYNF